jgi:alanine racemase
MDMTMIDVTDVAGVKEGDVVELFGRHIPVQEVAAWSGTIAYEIMTGISQRVKRVYVEE